MLRFIRAIYTLKQQYARSRFILRIWPVGKICGLPVKCALHMDVLRKWGALTGDLVSAHSVAQFVNVLKEAPCRRDGGMLLGVLSLYLYICKERRLHFTWPGKLCTKAP